MKWKKGSITDNDGKPIDCWRSDNGVFLFYLNHNAGDFAKRGELDRRGHKWEYEVVRVSPDKLLDEINPSDEEHVGYAPTKKAARILAELELEEE